MVHLGRWETVDLGVPRAIADETRINSILRARLHRMMRFTMLCVPFGIPGLLLTLLPRAKNGTYLLIWVGLALAAALVQWLAYLRNDPKGDWTFQATWTQTLGGLVWGLFPWLAMPEDPVWQAVTVGLPIAVLMAAALFASTLRATYIAFLAPATVFGSVGFFVVGDGDARWCAFALFAIGAFAGVLAEASHRNQYESATLTVKLHQQARTDELTGLANRAGFVEALGNALSSDTNSVGVAFLDLDGFKAVNDQMGHATGDELLVAVGARLIAQLRDDALVARYGGDEFTVVVPATNEIEMADIKRRIKAVFSDPFKVGLRTADVGASIGLYLAPPGTSLDAALREADDAQYQAKRRSQRARGTTARSATPGS